MSTHSIPAAHPMPAHTARRAVIKVASTIAHTLAGAWHTPATAGDFRADASIQTPDVVSVVRAVK